MQHTLTQTRPRVNPLIEKTLKPVKITNDIIKAMNHAIILCAGQGQRMTMKKDKLLLPVCGNPLIYYTIMAFNDHPKISSITIVANKFNQAQLKEIAKTYKFPKVKNIVLGGVTRQNSVENGVNALKNLAPDDVILTHNGANPLPSRKEISQVIKGAKEVGACISGHYVTSTVKEVDQDHVIKTHDRNKLFAAETPQAATLKVMNKALENAKKKRLEVTDEAMLFEAINQKVTLVEAHENNFKITTQGDYAKLRAVLGDYPDGFRVGIGQDSHMFEEKIKGLTLGGILIKEELKLKANSDGDVILHAIFNALSQAIGEMSLGFYADSECEKGVKDSKKYLQIVLKKIKKEKFKINSLGIMIEGARPKIDPLVPKLKTSLAKILETPAQRIGITATTGEKCTVFGEGLGLQCLAIVSLVA